MRTETFETPGPIQLGVEIRSGSVFITAAEVTQTTVEIEGKHADEVVVEQEEGAVWVETPKARGLGSDREWAIDLRITTPAHGDVTVQSGSAPIAVKGSVQTARVKTGSGDVQLDEVAAEALVDTGSGQIVVGRCSGDTRLRTGSGGVEAAGLRGEAIIATGSGHASVGELTGNLGYKAGSGHLRVGRMHGDLKARTGSGRLDIGRICGGEIDVRTGSGDVTVHVPLGTPVWTDIVSGRPVESSLPSAGEPAPGQDFVKLNARTGTGVVRLRADEMSRTEQIV